jgi:hypothetical protein
MTELGEKVRVGECYWTREGGVAWVAKVGNICYTYPIRGLCVSLETGSFLHHAWETGGRYWLSFPDHPADLVARVCGKPWFPDPLKSPMARRIHQRRAEEALFDAA